MILIPKFFERIQPFLQGTHPVHQAFLHHLFPGSVAFPVDSAEIVAGAPGAAVQKVALLGYWALRNPHKKDHFAESLRSFRKRDLSGQALILDDLAALMGISLGIRHFGSKEDAQWWTRQLGRWSNDLLQVSSQVEFNRLLTRGQAPTAADLPDPYLIYLLLQSEETVPEQAQLLKDFFVRTRKKEFPGPLADFHLTMLNIYGMDACFRRCIWEEEQVEALQAEVREKFDRNVVRRAEAHGKWLALAIYGTGIPLVGWSTFAFIRQLSVNPGWGGQWELLEQALTLFGGPIALLFILIRIGWDLIGRHPPALKFGPLAQNLGAYLARRRRRRYGLTDE